MTDDQTTPDRSHAPAANLAPPPTQQAAPLPQPPAAPEPGGATQVQQPATDGREEIIVGGGELYAALKAKRAEAANGPRRFYPWGDDKFELVEELPTGAQFYILQAQDTGKEKYFLKALKIFFKEGEGDRFVDALAAMNPDEQTIEKIMVELAEHTAQRPLDK